MYLLSKTSSIRTIVFSSPYSSIFNIAKKLFSTILLLLGIPVLSQPITGQSPFGGIRSSQLEMAVLSKHEESNLRQSVEAWLRTKGYEITFTETGESSVRYKDTEEATNFQAQEASKNESDIIAIQVPISSPVFAPVKHN
jgi:hypothetical protein